MTAHATAETPTDGVRYDNPFADDLRRELRPGTTVFTVLRHRARSGMSRDIDLYAITGNQPYWLCAFCSQSYVAPAMTTCPTCVKTCDVVDTAHHWHNDGGYALVHRWI